MLTWDDPDRIADALFLAEGTVKNHVTKVLAKLEVLTAHRPRCVPARSGWRA